MEYECKYCLRKFINEKFLNRHQKTFKFCVEYQNKFIKDELENLNNQKSLIEDKINNLNISYDNLTKKDNYLNSKDIENEKSKEIEKLFLSFEKIKNSIEDEYGLTLNKIVLKNNINENIGEYCNIDKLKIEKLSACYNEFEKTKKDIESKYDKLIVAEKIFEEQEKIEEQKIQDQNTHKEIFEKYKNIQDENIHKNLAIENELNELINNKEISLDHKLIIKKILNDIKDIKKNNENKIKKISSTINIPTQNKNPEFNSNSNSNSNFNSNSNSNFNYNSNFNSNSNSEDNFEYIRPFETIETENNDEYLKEYEDMINKLIYHLNILLSDYEMNNKNILYIIIQLFKFLNINICNIPLDKIKLIINYVLKNYISNNTIIDDEYLKIFLHKYLDHYIDILVSINNKEITIKNKKLCFFPICY